MGNSKPLDTQDPKQFISALPLLWASVAFLLGILFASAIPVTTALWLLLAGAVVFAIWQTRKKQLGRLPSLTLVALFALFNGAARYAAALPNFDQSDLAYYNDRSSSVEITGVIAKPAITRDGYIEFRLQAEKITTRDQDIEVDGLFLARVASSDDLNYGDRVILFGKLETPEVSEDFSYQDYLARQGIYSLMPFANVELVQPGVGNIFWAAIYGFRDRALDVVYQLYPDPEASLFAGILLGDESGLSEELKTAFNDTGTRHIIAISGFNISIIAGLFLAAFTRWLGIRRAIWLTALGIGLYTLLVGAEASVARAAIMGVLALIARQVGRRQFALNTLAFTAAVMALINPLILWDVGFQLSFAATLGLVLYADRLRAYADKLLQARLSKEWVLRLSGPLYEFAFLTIAAQITTLPLLLYHFERLSLLSLPANLLILPVQPALMVLGGFSILLGLLWQPLGALIALLAWPLVAYTIRIVEAFAALPAASQTVEFFSLNFVFLYYAILLVVSIPPVRSPITLPRFRPAMGLMVLAAFAFWLWSLAMAAPGGRLDLILLDVQGEALLIRTPGGRNVLINGGSSAADLSSALGRHLSPFNHEIDLLLVAGHRPDQINALVAAGVGRLDINQVGWASGESRMAADWYQDLETQGLPIIDLQIAQRIDLGDGASLEVIAIGEQGAILLLVQGNFQSLLPLGLDFDQLKALDINQLGQIDLLLLADSGYVPLNPPEWIAGLAPATIWLAGDQRELSLELQQELVFYQFLNTGTNGWLRVSTDGQQMWLDAAR
jgi:competence protein ComEC